MFSLIKGIWTVLKHSIRKERRFCTRKKSLICIPDGEAELYCRVIRMERNGVWPVIFAPPHVRWIASPYRLLRMNMADVIRNFSESIFHVAFSVDSVKKPALLMRSSSQTILKWVSTTATISCMRKNIF